MMLYVQNTRALTDLIRSLEQIDQIEKVERIETTEGHGR